MSLSSDLAAFYNAVEAAHGQPYLHRSDILQMIGPTADFQSFNAALEKLPPQQRLLVLLRALSSQRTALSPRLLDAELVVTFPGHDSINARHTLQVIRQMVSGATTEILIAGYAITDSGGVLSQLAAAAERGVAIMIVSSDWKDRTGKTAAELTAAHWPANAPQPRIHEYRNDSAQTAGMHIKCLLVDGTDMLIGSANFTFPGLNTNFEMGVRIKGHVAETARSVFDEFLRTGRLTNIHGERERTRGVGDTLAAD